MGVRSNANSESSHWPKSHSCGLAMVSEAQAGSLPGPRPPLGTATPSALQALLPTTLPTSGSTPTPQPSATKPAFPKGVRRQEGERQAPLSNPLSD